MRPDKAAKYSNRAIDASRRHPERSTPDPSGENPSRPQTTQGTVLDDSTGREIGRHRGASARRGGVGQQGGGGRERLLLGGEGLRGLGLREGEGLLHRRHARGELGLHLLGQLRGGLLGGPGTLARSPLAYQNIAIDRVSGALSAAKSACLNPLSDRELAAISALTLLVLGPTAPVGRLSTVPFLRLERFNSTEPHVLEPHLVHPMIREFLARAERGWQDGTGPVDLAA